MKIWQKWIACILIAALPSASFAGVQFDAHCQNHTQESHASAAESATDHCADADLVKESSKRDDCQCECSNDVACISASTSAIGITVISKSALVHGSEQAISYLANHLLSVNSPPLYRPPIS